ncbi:MAG TPA: coproporphyrinogen-III oxidase family protein [Bryobacteraceae bacterium]|nr:coproporphyrinogen-III oxidase family protein [Bryobacteraceae bacterium]
MPGVYISYPFCRQKCTFCNFASGVFSADMRRRYEQALRNEVRDYQWDWLPETLYFGGGTPSLMPIELLGDLAGAIPREQLCETTLECAPGTVTAEAAEGWAACGMNRVSLGVQSFVTPELRATGRPHDAGIVEQEIGILRNAGVENINIDLIAGLPGQTNDSWRCSLDWIERLAPPHVSVYVFEVDEDSRLGGEILKGGARYGAGAVPSEDLTAELYETAVDCLAALGIVRYEISNFARAGFESRHNLKYWQLEPYIGFGVDAHSFDGSHRWSNPDTLAAYFERPGGMRSAAEHGQERFFVGLRLMRGIEPTRDEWSRFAQPIEKWLHAGMLERDDTRLRLSRDGVLVSNEIFQDFIDA